MERLLRYCPDTQGPAAQRYSSLLATTTARQRSRTFLTNGPWARVFAAIIVTPEHIGVQFHRLSVSTRILTIPLPPPSPHLPSFKILDRLSSRPESFHRIEDKDPRTSDHESIRPLKSRPSSESTTKSLVRYRSKCSRHFLTSLRAGRHETLRPKSIRLNGKPHVRNFTLNSSPVSCCNASKEILGLSMFIVTVHRYWTFIELLNVLWQSFRKYVICDVFS